MRAIVKLINRIDSVLFMIAQIAVIFIMVITTIDSLLRFFFRRGIPGSYEITENYLMVALVFLSISYVWKIRGHINVDILFQRFPNYVKNILNFVYMVLIAAIMLAIGYQGLSVTIEAYTSNYVSTGIVQLPTWISWVWIPIGAFMFVIRLILTLLVMIIAKNDIVNDEKPEAID